MSSGASARPRSRSTAKHIEKDAALERRFQPVMVEEPSVEDTISILRGLKEKYEVHHGVRIKDSALVAAATLSHRYITDRFLPDKAIDLIDEATSRLRIEIDSMPAEIDDMQRKITQLEIEREALKKEKDRGFVRETREDREGDSRSSKLQVGRDERPLEKGEGGDRQDPRDQGEARSDQERSPDGRTPG